MLPDSKSDVSGAMPPSSPLLSSPHPRPTYSTLPCCWLCSARVFRRHQELPPTTPGLSPRSVTPTHLFTCSWRRPAPWQQDTSYCNCGRLEGKPLLWGT